MNPYRTTFQGNLLRGKVLLEIHHYRDCIDELLNCVLKDSSYSTDVVSLISLCAQGILGLTGDFMAGLTGGHTFRYCHFIL